MSFRKKVFLYFIGIFIVFVLAVLLFQLNREKKFKVFQLENELEYSSDIIHNFINHNRLLETENLFEVDSLRFLLAKPNLRITIIGRSGIVLYDSFVEGEERMENHLLRPEIQKALYTGSGSNIRKSETTNQEFYYFAKFYDEYFVRAAMVYDIQLESFLKAERYFLIFIVFIFIIIWILIDVFTRQLSVSVTRLKDFAIKAGKYEPIDTNLEFPDNELGEIGSQIVKIYTSLHKAHNELEMEKERFFNHMHILNEGIAFFSPQKEKILANSNFIQFISIISHTSTVTAEFLFTLPEFRKINNFLRKYQDTNIAFSKNDVPQIEYTINKNERYFKLHCIIFADKSFEILITDITRPEKRRLLKQQLTSNIAHELKTPLASIKGYLETLVNNQNIDSEKKQYFISRAYAQAERMNLLLNDISFLNNIEDAGELFEFREVNIGQVVHDVVENLDNRLLQNNIKCKIYIDENIVICGNDSLLFSVFQNLIENSINYAGKNVNIEIRNYLEDKLYQYFSYSDDGIGIPEEHLQRIFERFYRVDSGRTREHGGTGLGLSIVKNAILLHKGKITVRNKPEGGIEFLFTIAKR